MESTLHSIIGAPRGRTTAALGLPLVLAACAVAHAPSPDPATDVAPPEPADASPEGSAPPRTFAWATGAVAPTSAESTALDLASDATGDLYVVGKLRGVAHVGDAELASAGDHDAFVARLAPTGDIRWARRLGGPGRDAAHGVAVHEAVGVIVTGAFRGSIEVDGVRHRSEGDEDGLVWALDPDDGETRWLSTFGTLEGDGGHAVAATEDGTVYVAGYAECSWASTRARIDAWNGADGSLRWTRTLDAPNDHAEAFAIAASPAGGVFVAGQAGGRFSSSLDVTTTGDDDPNRHRAFVARLDADGEVAWLHALVDWRYPRAEAIAHGPDGELYAAGRLDGGAFVGRLDPSDGVLRWTDSVPSNGDAVVRDLAVDAGGHVHAIADVHGILEIEGTPGAQHDVLVRVLDPDGEPVESRIVGEELAWESATALVVEAGGDRFLAGTSSGSLELPSGFFVAQLATASR